MHIVSFNREMYTDVATAITKPGGLAVLGVLFKQESRGMLLKSMGDFLKALPSVKEPHKQVSIPAFKPGGLLGGHTSSFYRYRGSLTTPPCTENVIWTVLHDKIPVSAQQVYKLYFSYIRSKF